MNCKHCNKEYKREKAFIKHERNCQKNKTKIPGEMRAQVWETYIGDTISAKCFCCWKNTITPFTGRKTFQAGHIISQHNGGKITIGNLLPICRDCNGASGMGSENWDDYVKRVGLPSRVFGDYPSQEKIRAIITTQSLCRMYLTRKAKPWRKLN